MTSGMSHSKIMIGLCAVAFAVAGCKKDKGSESGSGSATTTGSATAPATGSGSATGSASTTAATGSGSATASAPTPTGKDQLTSAAWKDQKAGPLAFDRQVGSDDGNGNLQVFLIMNCPKGPEGCALLKYDNLKTEDLDAACKGWSMIHLAFGPSKGNQKAGMGKLALKPGKYGNGEAEPLRIKMVEYTNSDRSIGGQSAPTEPSVEITAASDTQIAGTFDSKDRGYAYQGSFTAQKCTCDPNQPICK